MVILRVLFAVLTLTARAHPALVSVPAEASSRADDVTIALEPHITGGYEVVLVEGDKRTVFGHIGRTILSSSAFTLEDVEEGVQIQVGNANLAIRTLLESTTTARGFKIRLEAGPSMKFTTRFDFGTKHWYAGPMQFDQVYPIENAEQVYSPSFSKETDNGAIAERYWLNSAGEYIYVHSEVPLFIDYHNLSPNHLSLGAEITTPYSSRRNQTVLAYDLWFLPNVKEAHMHAVANYLGKPSGLPDYRMVQHPIWSTWVQYSRDINNTNLLDFATQIQSFGFTNSQFEIDDLWEVCYGSFTVDERKFPNFTKTVQDIRDLGFRVTIWAHPFINKDCEPWYSEALNNGFFVLDESGSPDTTWWNNNGSVAGYIDFTNTRAAEWWVQRLRNLLNTYNIDSIKFDAGESSFTPQIAVQTGDIIFQPHNIVEAYARTCARFGDMIEIRAGFRTQDLPVYVRMVGRDSTWGLNNGLSTIITTTFQMNLNGYTFVLPDMIGGNGYNLDRDQAALPNKELFIRWVQANTFLPVMQYSFAPWNFDDQTVQISKKYTELHTAYAGHIYAAMKKSVELGEPVNPPIWWIAPHDEETFVIWDEYLVGENILVAPVLVEGATSRDIYLPAGTWYEEGDLNRKIEGPLWLRDYPAPIDVLPYFVKDVPNISETPDISDIPDIPGIPGTAASLTISTLIVVIGIMLNIVM